PSIALTRSIFSSYLLLIPVFFGMINVRCLGRWNRDAVGSDHKFRPADFVRLVAEQGSWPFRRELRLCHMESRVRTAVSWSSPRRADAQPQVVCPHRSCMWTLRWKWCPLSKNRTGKKKCGRDDVRNEATHSRTLRKIPAQSSHDKSL